MSSAGVIEAFRVLAEEEDRTYCNDVLRSPNEVATALSFAAAREVLVKCFKHRFAPRSGGLVGT